MGDNDFKNTIIEILTLEDIDKVLDNAALHEALYDALKVTLVKALEGEVLNEALKVSLAKVLKGNVLNETLHTMLFKALKGEALDKVLVNLKEDKEKYRELYAAIDEELLKQLENNELDAALTGLFDAALDEVLNEIDEKIKLCINAQSEVLQTESIDYSYYLEVSKVFDWCHFSYRNCSEDAKEFIKKYIDTIVESDNPNKVLEGLLLFQKYQLHTLKFIQNLQGNTNDSKANEYLERMIKYHCKDHITILGLFDKLLGPWTEDNFNKFLDMPSESIQVLARHLLELDSNFLLASSELINAKVITLKNLNRDNLIAFIENPSLSLKVVTVPPEPSQFDFAFLLIVLKALFNFWSCIAIIKASINVVKDSRQQYKKYQEELEEVTKIYEDKLAQEIGKEEIDFREVARILCNLGQLPRTSINGSAKKNPIIDQLVKKFNCPNTDDPIIKSKLEVIVWLNEGFYRNLHKDGKDFIQQHIDKVMDSVCPREALNALYLIYFYKLHNKTNIDTIIDVVLNNDLPEVFLNELIRKLITPPNKEHPILAADTEIESALDELVEQSSPRLSSDEQPIEHPCSLVEGEIGSTRDELVAQGLPSSNSDEQAPKIIESTTAASVQQDPMTPHGSFFSSYDDSNKPYGKPVVHRPQVVTSCG